MLALVAARLDPPPPPVSGTARASDGDSFRLGDDRVRLLGLDAPELAQQCLGADGLQWPCGRAARDRMAALLASGNVDCIPQDKDQYDRLLARCTIDKSDLGATMVAEGLAVSSGDYWREEQAARAARLGIWAGGFDRPADWREDHPRPQGVLGWFGL
ncbi:thermonuclease family protein [Devosia sp. SL43]|uniref:thermonuclease family protein n=1 Tax=Devosia sp. SL43 TaxID=2806348 RepID=UPI001F2FC115|nr:thermonuclease family protein [Devosia sp. SL43]UJW87881.1 thermonuclease family protein [Devosia sp. SL43]